MCNAAVSEWCHVETRRGEVHACAVAGCAGPAAGGAAGGLTAEAGMAPRNSVAAACAPAARVSAVCARSSNMVCLRDLRPWPGLLGLESSAGAVTDRPTGEMVPPWGLTATRPGVTAIRAGAMFSP